VIQQWTPEQVHDTVAAIVAQPDFTAAQRQSLIGRVLRYVGRWLNEFFSWSSGSVDGRLIVGVAVAVVVCIVAGRIIAERRYAVVRRTGRSTLRAGERRDYHKLARELAESGRLIEASHALYAAVLDDLTRVGAVKYHLSKTSGDYTRELGRSRSLPTTDFREFGRVFDRAVYGHDVVTLDEWHTLSALAERIVRSVSAPRAA
jgi:hypothetical protein